MAITTGRLGTYTIEQTDSRTLPDDELRALAELSLALHRERLPEDPEPPIEVVMQRMRVLPKLVVRSGFVAKTDDGTVVGRGWIDRYEVAENRRMRDVELAVHAAHRGRGLGRAIFGRVVAVAADQEDLVLNGWTSDRVPAGEAFAKRLGAKLSLANRKSELDLTALDHALVADWVRIDPAGYRLEWIDGAFTPERLVPNVIVAYDTMNTAPRGDLEHEDWKATPEMIRDFEQARQAEGRGRRLVLAVDEATGETAGFTEVAYDPRYPFLVNQQGTAVVPAHRGHGIGKWIKARMLERILADWPGARLVRTGNAYANAPMLSINQRLGFRAAWSVMEWQLPIADARRYAEGRGL